MNTVQVIDAPCGVGKTSWAIQNINEKEEDSFIFCTPFLDEIDRVRCSCGGYARFKEPLPYNGSKLDNFNELLADGVDIAVTHTTFLNATKETLELIRTGNYTLIIDEVLDVITEFNKVQSVEDSPRQTVSKGDIKMLLEKNIIEIQDDYKVIWSGGDYGDDCKFSEVERFAKLNRLYCIDGNFLLAVFPPELFGYFKNVYILTYMFGGSYFKYYFDLFGIEYELKSVAVQENNYYLTDYSDKEDMKIRSMCKHLISICDNKRMNDYRINTLSKSWYNNSKKDDRLKILKNNLRNYFERYLKNTKASNGDIMWTAFSDYEDKLKGKGFTCERSLSDEELRMSNEAKEAKLKELSCFVPCNARATNNYSRRWALAYCVNMHYHPMTRRFFTDHNEERIKNGLEPINPNEELYALSALIQWMFRSRIRKGQPISIYIPNKRMRELLIDWMNNKI